MFELSGDCTLVHSRVITGVVDGAALESELAIGLGLGCSSRGWWGPWWSILWVYWSAEAELLSPLTITHSLRTELLGRRLCPVIDRTLFLRHLSLSICECNFSVYSRISACILIQPKSAYTYNIQDLADIWLVIVRQIWSRIFIEFHHTLYIYFSHLVIMP